MKNGTVREDSAIQFVCREEINGGNDSQYLLPA